MRIWMINHYASPPSLAGGTRHFHFARQLIACGHEVILIAANYHHFSHQIILSSVPCGETDERQGVPFIWIPAPAYSGNTLSRFKNMLAFSWRLLQKKYLSKLAPPDVIVGSSPHLFAALSAQLLARRYRVPFVLEVRDLWPESLVQLGRFSTRHPMIVLMKKIERYLYRRADRIISLLPAAKNYFMKEGVSEDRIIWLPNAVDTDEVPTDLPFVVSDKFTIMYAGAHGLANDLDTILYAAKKLQDDFSAKHIQICLIGEGPEKERLKSLADHLKLTNVEFMDAVPKQKIYSILNRADAFLMLLKDSPVFQQGISPNKLFDYLIMSRPVIFGVNTPYNPIEKCNAGLSIPPSDPTSLASAMYDLSLLPRSELNDMGLRGRAYVMQYHHIQSLSHLLEKTLLEVAS